MKPFNPPFYSGETAIGKVVSLGPRFATLEVRRWIVPIEASFLDWNATRAPEELLSIGDRLEVVVYFDDKLDLLHHRHWMFPKQVWNGVWASRLPLLNDPWPALIDKYPEGSVVEVEMIDYVNWYIARARMPDGLVVELRTNDIHLRTSKTSTYARRLHPGERFKVVFRRLYRPGGWVERFMGGSMDDCLSESGYMTPRQGARRVTELEKAFIRRRNSRYSDCS
jgi:hypothetical protein